MPVTEFQSASTSSKPQAMLASLASPWLAPMVCSSVNSSTSPEVHADQQFAHGITATFMPSPPAEVSIASAASSSGKWWVTISETSTRPDSMSLKATS